VFDHGLLYGDGIFEGFALTTGASSNSRSTSTVCSIPRKAILLDIPMSHGEVMKAGRRNLSPKRHPRWLHSSIGDARHRHARVESEPVQGSVHHYHRRHNPALCPELYEKGMEIVTVPTTRNLHSALNPAIKSLIT